MAMSQPARPADRTVAFHVHGITKVYGAGDVEVQALRGVDLDIYRSEVLVLLGPSGSGKSTFLNILGGLDRPTSGEALFREHDLTRMSDRELTLYRRDHVGFVFQFYNLVPSLTARENVALVTEIAANPMTPAEALAVVGLEERQNHFPAQLSGGEQQRVAIARAVANAPRILLADEPTGNLDPHTADHVFDTLRQLVSASGLAAIIATHNLDLARRMDRRVTIREGVVVELD
jgi:putative ABC transport system ATP-binding protein